MVLSEFIRQYIDERGISGREFARQCNLSSQTIFNLLRGTNKDGRPIKIDTETLVKIANGTGYTSAKFSAINGIYYINIDGSAEENTPAFGPDEDMADYLENLRTRPELRMLFQTSKDMTPEQIRAVVQMIEGFKK